MEILSPAGLMATGILAAQETGKVGWCGDDRSRWKDGDMREKVHVWERRGQSLCTPVELMFAISPKTRDR